MSATWTDSKATKKQKAHHARAHKHWYARPWVWILVVLVVIFAVVGIALQPIANYATRKALAKLDGAHADFEKVHVSIIPIRYQITHFKLTEDKAGKNEPPLIYVDKAIAGLSWKNLFHRQLVLTAEVIGAKTTMVRKPNVKAPPLNIGDQLRKVIPLEVDRVALKNCEVNYVFTEEKAKHENDEDRADKPTPKLWIHHIDVTVEHLATRPDLQDGLTTFAVSATLQKTGEISVFGTINPLAKYPTFAGQASVKNLQLEDLYALIVQETKMKVNQGSIDMFARFESKEGVLTGGVKPLLKNAKVEAESPKLIEKLKAGLADLALKIFSDRVPGRNAVATIIPIEGNLAKPNIQVWPTILSVLRNAFVEGLSASFVHTPAPEASEPQGPLTQARRALSKKGSVPLTQPKNDEKQDQNQKDLNAKSK